MSLLDKFKKSFEIIGKKKTKSGQTEAVQKTAQDTKAVPKEANDKKSEVTVQDQSGKAGRILIRPLQSEKVTDLMEQGKYAFAVAVGSNKSEVAKAIKAVYHVEPAAVNIINMIGKSVRFGRKWSRRKNWKKAIVTLKPGDKIEVFEGV